MHSNSITTANRLAIQTVQGGTNMLPRQIREHIKGNFVFKVSLGKVWRTIGISSENTLDDLHLAIQGARRENPEHGEMDAPQGETQHGSE